MLLIVLDKIVMKNDYINTKELLKQQYISITCGTIYSNLFESDFFFSSLDHSIAVALIIWHFTHSKEQTLSGLFHDIATPVFKHEDRTRYSMQLIADIIKSLNKDGKVSKEKPSNVYYVHHGAKVRYIDPLLNGNRISETCKIAKNMIDKNLSYDMSNYVYLDGIKF